MNKLWASMWSDDQDVEHITQSYSLDKTKALGRKLGNLDNPNDIEVECTSGGIRLFLNTIFYEAFTKCAIAYLRNLGLFSSTTQVVDDQDGVVVIGTIKLAHKVNKTLTYTINFYPTTSSFLVNGKHADRFLQTDLPKICDKAYAMCANIDIDILKEVISSQIKASLDGNIQAK